MPIMRAAWLNDIHLNFLNTRQLEEFLAELAAGRFDALLLGGDIAEARDLVEHLRRLAERVPSNIYFVLGNHDYYFGSIADVRQRVRALCRENPPLVWLNDVDVVELTPQVGLVGHDGWPDGRLGRYDRSPVELNDFHLIAELATDDKQLRLVSMQRLAQEAADHFRRVLPPALERYERVIVLTHVPPFREACWHAGRISDDDWLPFFSSRAVGDVLLEAMQRHPQRKMTVLCGHTHGKGQCHPLQNLEVLTAAAEYGEPGVQQVLQFE